MPEEEITTVTTTKRTTPKKAASIPKFESKAKHRTFKFDAFGRVWTLKQPNQVVTSQFIEDDDIGQLIKYLMAHVVKDEREDFVKTLAADEDFDLEMAIDLSRALAEVVYADIPTNPS